MVDTFRLDPTQDPKVISGSRLFDAPRSLVFEAWTDPKHLAHWWGPNGFSLTTHSFDFRAGGVWRFVMHGPDGRDYQNRVTFDEIVAPERIAYHHGGGDDVEPVQFRTLVTFEDMRGKTRLRALVPDVQGATAGARRAQGQARVRQAHDLQGRFRQPARRRPFIVTGLDKRLETLIVEASPAWLTELTTRF